MDLSSISNVLDDSAAGHTKKGVLLSPSSHFDDNHCTCCSNPNPMASSSTALKSFLDHIPIDSIIKFLNSPVMELKHDDCVKDAMRSFYDRNIFGAPIVHSVTSDRGDYIDRDIGFIEFSSMALWSLEEFDKASADSKSGNHGFLSTLDQVSEIGQTKIGELAKFFLWEPFFPVNPSATLLQVLLLFSKHNTLKVVPVVESSNSHVVGFITQNAVLQLLLRSCGLEWFDGIVNRTISEAGFEKKGFAVYMFGDETVADALHILWEKHIDVIPVVDRMKRKLIGMVRSSDIYLLLEDDELYHNRKSFSVEDFINSYSRRTKLESDSLIMPLTPLPLKNSLLPPMDSPKAVQSSDSLRHVMQEMLQSNSECCFLVTESGQLRSTITLRDIMSQFSPPCMDATIDGGGFFQSALEQAGCRVEHGAMVRSGH